MYPYCVKFHVEIEKCWPGIFFYKGCYLKAGTVLFRLVQNGLQCTNMKNHASRINETHKIPMSLC